MVRGMVRGRAGRHLAARAAAAQRLSAPLLLALLVAPLLTIAVDRGRRGGRGGNQRHLRAGGRGVIQRGGGAGWGQLR